MSASRAAALPRARARGAVISPLTRLVLCRERRSILAWSLGGGVLALYCVAMFNTMYSTVEERRAAALTYSTPAAAVFTGPGFGMDAASPTMGALFAAQALGVLRQLGVPDDAAHVNPNGGAIALGHPLGMSGARLALSASLELQRRGGRYALCTMCIGVGQGIAMILERV